MAAPPNFSSTFSKTPPSGATPWSVLKMLAIETVVVIVLTVIAGTGNTAANFALGLVTLMWLLLLVSHA
jgi:hypothetical protein